MRRALLVLLPFALLIPLLAAPLGAQTGTVAELGRLTMLQLRYDF